MKHPIIYISTLAFKGETLEEILSLAQKNDWAIEFSSGIGYRDDLEKIYREATVTRIPHNYFPAPKEPFVLNLASKDDGIRRRSIAHCKQGIALAKHSNSPFFAAHAGFCIDPNPEELGEQINISKSFDRSQHWSLFIDAVQDIVAFAEAQGVDFLIENNVIAKFNLFNGENPLLCCDSNEIISLCNAIESDRFGILLDTAHFKVSANTLGFSLDTVTQFNANIRGIHHSDNNGERDTNSPIKNDYWFLPYLKAFSNIPHTIEVKSITTSEITKQKQLIEHQLMNY